MENQVISVSEALALINQTLEFAYPEVVIEGEVSSYKVNQGKWVFFDIKDQSSSLGCFLPIFQLKTPLTDGMLVRVHTQPKLTAWGKFSLTVRSIELAGEGSVKKSFELLKANLEKEGIFAAERKRALPKYPHRIALITSKQAAAYNDFVTILNDRWVGMEIEHLHVQVQGESAPDQIVRAIEYCNTREYDVIVIIRGGGSSEDLQAFQTEPVVRAIYASTHPTLVAIGHEDDVCLAELVADKRCATPTDAARQLVPDKNDALRHIRHTQDNLGHNLMQIINRAQNSVVGFTHAMQSMLRSSIAQVQTFEATILYQVDAIIQQRKTQLLALQSSLVALDPQAVLQRGYALVTKKTELVRSSSQLKKGDAIMIQLAHGTIGANVSEIKENQL